MSVVTEGSPLFAHLTSGVHALQAGVSGVVAPASHRDAYLDVLDRWASFARTLADAPAEDWTEASFTAERAANELIDEVEYSGSDWLETSLRCSIEAAIASRWLADAREDRAILSGHIQLGSRASDIREVLDRPAAGPAEAPLPLAVALLEWTYLLWYAATVQAWVNGQRLVDAGRAGLPLDERLQRIAGEGARCDDLFEVLEGVRQSYTPGEGDEADLAALRKGYERVFKPWFEELFQPWLREARVVADLLPTPPTPSFLMTRGAQRRWVATPELDRALDAARSEYDVAVLMEPAMGADWGDARAAAERCIELDSGDPRGWFLVGLVARAAGTSHTAARAFAKADELGGPDPAVLGELARVLCTAEEHVRAQSVLEAAASARSGPVSDWLERVGSPILRARSMSARRWGVDEADYYRVLRAEALLDVGEYAGAADVMQAVRKRNPALAGDAAGLLARALATVQLQGWSGFTLPDVVDWRPAHGPVTSFPLPVRRFLGGEDGRNYLLPLSHEAVTGTLVLMRSLESTLVLDEHAAALVSGIRKIAEDQEGRRFDGGGAVPAASALIGAGILATSGVAGLGPALVGVGYLACAALYFHACRVQSWRLNIRRVGQSGDGFLGGMGRDGIAGVLMGFFCLGAFAPLVVAWKYVSNYLTSGASERPAFET
jgi:hypothetical protein